MTKQNLKRGDVSEGKKPTKKTCHETAGGGPLSITAKQFMGGEKHGQRPLAQTGIGIIRRDVTTGVDQNKKSMCRAGFATSPASQRSSCAMMKTISRTRRKSKSKSKSKNKSKSKSKSKNKLHYRRTDFHRREVGDCEKINRL